MRQVVLFLMIFFSLASVAQEKRKWRGNFLLSGLVEYQFSGDAILRYTDITRKGNMMKEKRASVVDGKFGFSDFIEEPLFAELSLGENLYSLFLDPTAMQVVVQDDTTIKVLGSWTNDDQDRIIQLEQRINQFKDDSVSCDAELDYASTVKDSFVVLKKMLEISNPESTLHTDDRMKRSIKILMSMPDELKSTPTGIRTSEALFLSSVKMFSK